MKRLVMILCCVLSLGIAFAASPKGTPQIEFASAEHDFGTIRESDGSVSCTFTYANTGNAPLALTTVSAPCGCTKPKYSHKPLAPGRKGEITVTFSPKDIKGEFTRTISVWTNVKVGNVKKKVILKIKGVVIPAK